jgi:hypothetical protein
MIQVERRVGLSLAAGICSAVLGFAAPSMVSAQTAQTSTHTKAAAKPALTSQDLYAYIRGALLAYSPDDRINDNLEVALDPTATVLTIKQPDGHCDIFLNALDANTITWDFYDASDSMASRQPLARLTVISVPGKNARTCYDLDNQVDTTISGNRARLLFAWGKIPEESGFQTKMTKAMKKLIALCGGSAEKDIFKP